jgi:hypothetical protein
MEQVVPDGGQLLLEAVRQAGGERVVAHHLPALGGLQRDAAPGGLVVQLLLRQRQLHALAGGGLRGVLRLLQERLYDGLVLLAAEHVGVGGDGDGGLAEEVSEQLLILCLVLDQLAHLLLHRLLRVVHHAAAGLHDAHALLLGDLRARDAAVHLHLLLLLIGGGDDLLLGRLDEVRLLRVIHRLGLVGVFASLLLRVALDELDHRLDLAVLASRRLLATLHYILRRDSEMTDK